MPYDPMLVQPMREELTRIGAEELLTPEDVDRFMKETSGTRLLIVNSVCGCAAGMARPGVAIALQNEARPDRVATVFAGQDLEATERARSYFSDYPPSSPSFALFKNGDLVHFVPRHAIEGRDAQSVAFDLVGAFDRHCEPQQARGAMGTFHQGRGELHGITVVVDPPGPATYVGRCDVIDDGTIVLLDADVHEERDGETSKEEYLSRAARFGVWKKHARLVVPLPEGTSVRRLGDLAPARDVPPTTPKDPTGRPGAL